MFIEGCFAFLYLKIEYTVTMVDVQTKCVQIFIFTLLKILNLSVISQNGPTYFSIGSGS